MDNIWNCRMIFSSSSRHLAYAVTSQLSSSTQWNGCYSFANVFCLPVDALFFLRRILGKETEDPCFFATWLCSQWSEDDKSKCWKVLRPFKCVHRKKILVNIWERKVTPNIAAQWWALLLHIREVPGPNVDPETGCSERSSRGFTQSLQANAGIVLWPHRLLPHLSNSLFSNYRFVRR
jgi:hypothetical protein